MLDRQISTFQNGINDQRQQFTATVDEQRTQFQVAIDTQRSEFQAAIERMISQQRAEFMTAVDLQRRGFETTIDLQRGQVEVSVQKLVHDTTVRLFAIVLLLPLFHRLINGGPLATWSKSVLWIIFLTINTLLVIDLGLLPEHMCLAVKGAMPNSFL
ncbi:hypothetical protein TWF718_002944 [Orbilia javanica]|uniref:Uncharacterized protein n=1 Tax=Orbilia javanica TaxID=47235 RepID=A0AAN8MT79_9PEZI